MVPAPPDDSRDELRLPAHGRTASALVSALNPAQLGAEHRTVNLYLTAEQRWALHELIAAARQLERRETSTCACTRVSVVQSAELVSSTTGTITAGLFKCDAFVQTLVTQAVTIAACDLGEGTISSLTSTVTLEITSV